MLQNKDGEEKLYKLFGRSSLVFFLSTFLSIVSAQSFSEFKKSQSDAFTSYLNQEDKTFDTYLTSNWEEYGAAIAASLYSKSKPEKIIPAVKIKPKARGPIVQITKKNVLENIKKDVSTIHTTTVEEKKDLALNYFGLKLSFTLPEGIKEARFYPQSKKGIRNFFNVLVSTQFEILLNEISNKSLEINLNDWGKYLLIKKISEKIFSNQDDSRLLQWFIFNKLGYSVRVGLAKKHILVMYESGKIIYNTPVYTIDKKKFYIFSNYATGGTGKLFTYKQSYPGANKVFDLSMDSLPKLEKNMKRKVIEFRQYMKKYTINYKYNQNIIDFMATYPQADYETFFNAPLTDESYQGIVNGLRKYINGKKSTTAINFVLNFVQNAFIYEVDSSQFGREKVMFGEETLYYNKSDCEDRAILFAKLVKDMFKVNVIGVRYKDHMATALHIPVKGDTVRVYSKKYVLADPTYRDAVIGQSMNKYKSKKPESFIFLKK